MKHAFARKLRRDQTDVERKLWQALRGRRFHGFKFRRQQPIGPYVADFVCLEHRLVVELDGDQHGSAKGLAYDNARAQRLMRDGFHILRFPNRELTVNFDGVLDNIERALACPLTRASALPSPTRGEGKNGLRQ